MRLASLLPLVLLGLTGCVVTPAPTTTTYVTPTPTTAYVAPAPATAVITPAVPATTTVIRTP